MKLFISFISFYYSVTNETFIDSFKIYFIRHSCSFIFRINYIIILFKSYLHTGRWKRNFY